MFGYIGSVLVGLVGYAVFSAFFPTPAKYINDLQLKLIQYIKDKFVKK